MGDFNRTSSFHGGITGWCVFRFPFNLSYMAPDEQARRADFTLEASAGPKVVLVDLSVK